MRCLFVPSYTTTMILVGLLASGRSVVAQSSSVTSSGGSRIRTIERVARRLANADSFSGVVLVARGDNVLYLGAFGMADKERTLPIRSDTHFQLASITKTFVTVAIARLVEQGKLSWNDPLGKFLPNFPVPAARRSVRIKHLLTHTSGLRDFRMSADPPRVMDDWVRLVTSAQTRSLLYEPGTRPVYTNANFLLLAKIVELVSGQPFAEYIRAHVFGPAAMFETDFFVPGPTPNGIATGYEKRHNHEGVHYLAEPLSSVHTGYPAPHCCSYSTARDLFRFGRALRTGRLLRPRTVDLLFAPKPEAGHWGYGFDVLDERRGLVGHGGSWTGQSNSIDIFTKSDYIVVILSNYTGGRSPLRETIRSILP